jgi:hypothetical protein
MFLQYYILQIKFKNTIEINRIVDSILNILIKIWYIIGQLII